jgi:putative ABC transport system permease protein
MINASTEGHSGLLVVLLLLIASVIATVGLIGLGSMMSTNVLERTREFGVMSAVGAPASAVRNLVVFEGIFIAVISCVVAAVPALILTSAMGAGLGNLFMGAPVPFRVSGSAIVIWVVIVVVGASLATLAPASRASRMTVREALAYL